jgi:hypothetical protein
MLEIYYRLLPGGNLLGSTYTYVLVVAGLEGLVESNAVSGLRVYGFHCSSVRPAIQARRWCTFIIIDLI